MAGQHKGHTKGFRALSFAEQAKSITATINNLQAAIEQHAEHSSRRAETIEKCLAQIDGLRQRLRTISCSGMPIPIQGKRFPVSKSCLEYTSGARAWRTPSVRPTSRWTSLRRPRDAGLR